jgi:agmatine deiminase
MPDRRSYFMPAEWAPHQGTWWSWPHNPETWPGCLEAAERAVADAIVALAASETVHVNVRDGAARDALIARLEGRISLKRLCTHLIPTNDAWCRDHGAIFVRGGAGGLVAIDFRFNAWGGKYPPWDLDDAAGGRMAAALGVPCVRLDFVLEGGSIEVNGAGLLLTTEQCLLNPNRNPGSSRDEIEATLRRFLGVSQVVWLGGGIDGDDTDGHIDDITRFVAEDRVVTCVERERGDVNHGPLEENLERLRAVRLPDGRALSIVQIPMPEPLERDGRRLPASYANFYIGNSVVLVPVFGGRRDAEALAVLATCFPGRRLVAIDCREVVVGLGTFHCLTQQVPAP